MLKTASLTIRVKPDTRSRLDSLARATRRSKSFVIEEALEQYLEVNEWQIQGIVAAVAEADSSEADSSEADSSEADSSEADSSEAEFVDHAEVLKRWEVKVARKIA